MSDAGASESVAPFESASELREDHANLLEALDREIEKDTDQASEAAALAHVAARVRVFLERGAATGLYLEDIKDRTACQVLLDYWASILLRAGMPVPGARLAGFDWNQLPDLKDKPCPYVGLDAFQDPTFFFGREADTDQLLAQLRDTPLVVVLGASGSGKSSLVMGGLLPALRTKGTSPELFIVPPLVPGNAVLDHLADAVLEVRAVPSPAPGEAERLLNDPSRLAALLGGAYAPPTLITIDQFEEVFTLCGSTDRDAVVAQLAGALEAGRGHRVILTMREEFRTRMVELRALGPYLAKAWYSMRPMGYEELRAAVDRPAAKVNLQIKSEISDELVKTVLGQPAALPLLQFTLRALWDKRDRNRITLEVYRKVGDPLNALRASADAFFERLLPQTQEEVKRILLELVQVTELLEAYRQPVPRSRLRQGGKANTNEVLDLLSRQEFVRITSMAGETDALVEIKHESLVRNWPRFVGWIDEKRHQRRQHLSLTQAAERWRENGRPGEGLLTGWQLQEAERLADLSGLEREFVQASKEALDRKQQEKEAALRREVEQAKTVARQATELAMLKSAAATRRTLFLVLTMVVAFSLGVAALQYRERGTVAMKLAMSTSEALQAKSEALQAIGLQPLDYVNDHLDLALLLGIEASRKAQALPGVRRILPSALTMNLELESLLSGHSAPVLDLAYSPKGEVLASASADGTIILRSGSDGSMLRAPLKADDRGIVGLAFTPDGKRLASASYDGTVRLWNVETGEAAAEPFEHGAEVFGVAIAKDGTTLASAGEDGTVRVWNIPNHEELATLAHSSTEGDETQRVVTAVAFSPKDALLASGGLDGRIVLWSVKKWRQAGILQVNQPVFSIAFSHDGKTIASGSREGRTDLWDVPKRKWIGTSHEDHLRAVRGVAFSPDDKQLATVSEDRTLFLRKVKHLELEPQRASGYGEQLYSVAFSPGGKVATGAANGMVVVWDFARYHRVAEIVQRPTRKPTQAAFGRDGKTLFSFTGGSLLIWDQLKGKAISTSVDAGQEEIQSMVPAPNGKDLVTIGSDNSVELWDLATRRHRTLVKPNEDSIVSAAISADSQTLALGITIKKRAKIWLLALSDGKSQGDPLVSPYQESMYTALAFSRDGASLASAGWDSGVTLWDLSRRKPRGEPLDHLNVLTLAFSPNGRLLASGGKDSTIQIWRIPERSKLSLEYHRGPVRSLRFSPDGTLLASAGNDRTVLLWDVDTGQRMVPPLAGHGEAVLSVDFSPDGEALVSAGEDGSIFKWRLGNSSLIWQACLIAGRNLTNEEWNRFFGQEERHVTCMKPLIDEADERALAGAHADAERLFAQASHLAPDTKDPRVNNYLCWKGSTNRFAPMVLPACERAVALAPEEGNYRDSRGLARALTGNRAGAIEDFTVALELINSLPDHGGYDAAFLGQREAWIAALKGGKDPFDPDTLRQLRTE